MFVLSFCFISFILYRFSFQSWCFWGNTNKMLHRGQCLIVIMGAFVKAQFSACYCSDLISHLQLRCSCFLASLGSTISITMVTTFTSQPVMPEAGVLLKLCCTPKCQRWANQPYRSWCGACLSTKVEQPAHTVECGERQEALKTSNEDWTSLGRVDRGQSIAVVDEPVEAHDA